MTLRSGRTRARLGALAIAGATLLLAGCAADDPGRPISVGTTVALRSLDPAATVHRDTLAVLSLLYPRLMSQQLNEDGTVTFAPELAETAEFTGDAEFTVTLPAGLTFSNGSALTASDVVFSFDRQFGLRDQTGTFPLLEGIVSVEAVDAQTVVFQLATADDATFPAVLAGPAGAILDEEVFSADATTADEVILSAASFGGRFAIAPPEDDPTTRDLLLEANPEYGGPDPVDPGLSIALELEREPGELADRLEAGTLEVAYGDFPLDEIASLDDADGVRVTAQESATLRLLFFDFEQMPFGADTEEADRDAAAAVRAAVADLIDREALAAVAPELWSPAASYLPNALAVNPELFASGAYGDAEGPGPDPERAADRLADAGVETPVELEITASTAATDPAGAALREELVAQLEAGGSFTVTVNEVEELLSREVLIDGDFPVFEYRWTPLGAGLDDYFTPLYSSTDGLPTASAESRTDGLIQDERTTLDPGARADAVTSLEERLRSRLPAIPLLASTDLVFASTGVTLGDTSTPGLGWIAGLTRR